MHFLVLEENNQNFYKACKCIKAFCVYHADIIDCWGWGILKSNY